MMTDLILEEDCGGQCVGCIKTRRMVSAVVTGTLNHLVGWLDEGDLERSGRAAARFLNIIAKAPESTRELVGIDNMSQLATAVGDGLSKIRRGDAGAASIAIRVGLMNWYETYPPYRA
jgi:hypothetical protein